MNIRERIFTACALGGGVGAFLAHQLFYPSGWSILLGFLAGGLVSYLAYDFRGFLAAIPKAWSKTVNGIHEYGTLFVLYTLAVITFLSFVPLLTVGVKAMNLSANDAGWAVVFLATMWCIGLFTVLLRHLASGADLKDFRETCIFIIKWFNPITILLVAVPYLIFVTVKVTVKYAVLFLPRLFRNLFVLIHSELRLLCFFDGGLGAVAGAMVSDAVTGALIGALAGGIFGVLNYEIISKRVLKLVPVK